MTISGASEVGAILVDSDGRGVLSAGALEATIRATMTSGVFFGLFPMSGDGAVLVRNIGAPLTVRVDFGAQKLELEGDLTGLLVSDDEESEELRASLSLGASIRAFPPTARTTVPERLECNVPGGALLELDGGESLPQSEDVLLSWHLGNPFDSEPIAHGPSAEVMLPLGEHAVALVARTSSGQAHVAGGGLVVEDSAPPRIRYTGPKCLWPPNHKYAVLRLHRDFVVEDACDPNPALHILGISDQPDNDTGDGNTVDDIVVLSDRICVRQERSGRDRDGRTYTLVLEAQDETGNLSREEVNIIVTHSQAGVDCDASGIEAVDWDDPLCQAEADGVSPDTGEQPAATGCATARSGSAWSWFFGLISLGWLLARRFRRYQ